jgi:hypothetical protein
LLHIVGFKKKREIFQIHIKQGTNHVDLPMDEVVQNNMPFQNIPFNFSFKYESYNIAFNDMVYSCA